MNSLNSSKFKSTKRYRRRKVRENNKNKYGADKNLNHQVTQKVWRLPGGPREKQQQQQQQQQEKYKNMHSMTSRHQERPERQGPQDDITKVKTLQDATLKASRLYGMMRDFIHPSKINYRKIHSKWRNVKKQVQVGGDKIMYVKAGTGPEAVPVDDKDCVELPPKMSLHVTQDPLNTKQFIVTKKDGDPLINGSLTTFAEGLMGHLDKIKSGIEIDIGDADILALIAHDLISIILDVLDSDEDDDDEGEAQKRLKAALDRESRNAAAAAIIIALIGLIKNNEDGDNSTNVSGDVSDVDSHDSQYDHRDQLLVEEIEGLYQDLDEADAYIHDLQGDNRLLDEENRQLRAMVDTLTQRLESITADFNAWRRNQADLNAYNLRQVHDLQTRNRQLHAALQGLVPRLQALQTQLGQIQDQNHELTTEAGRLRQFLQYSQQESATRLDQIASMDQQAQRREVELNAQIAVLETNVAQQQETITNQASAIRQLDEEVRTNKAQIVEAQGQLEAAEAANQDTIQGLRVYVQRLTEENAEKKAQLAASQKKLSDDDTALKQTQEEITRLKGENLDTQQSLTGLQKQHRRTQTELDSALQNAKELEQQISTAQTETDAEKAAKVQLQKRVDAQRLRIGRLTDTFNREKAELGHQNDAQQRELDALQSKHADTERQLKGVTQRSQDLNRQLQSLQGASAEKDVLARQLRQVTTEKQELSEKSRQENQQIANLRSQLEAQAEEIRAKDARIAEAEAAKNAAEAEAERQQQAKQAIDSELAALQKKLHETSSQNTQERDSLTAQIQAAQIKHDQLESAAQDATRRLDEKTHQLQAVTEENERVKTAAESSAAAAAAAATRLAETNQQLEQANKEKEAANARRAELDETLQELRREAELGKARSNLEFQTRIRTLDAELEANRKKLEQAESSKLNLEKKFAEQTRQIADDKVQREALKSQNDSLQAELAQLKKAQEQLAREAAMKEQTAQQAAADAAAAQQRFDEDKQPLSHALADVMKSIGAMNDKNPCKREFQRDADEIGVEISILTPNTIYSKKQNLEFRMKNLSESTGTKIRTYVAMRGGDDDGDDSGITFDTENKTVTTPGRVPWGAFSGVFDESKTNEDKYNGMLDILSPIPDGHMVLIFGYGYSGSGKTYTLLGGAPSSGVWDKGIAERAIDDYIKQGCTVDLEEAFEMYNDSYNCVLSNYFYGRPTSPQSLLTQSITNITSLVFRDECSRIDAARKKSKHIKPTTNNDKSSRGHLFIQLKVTRPRTDKVGRLIICDMGGRENPNEMWTSGQYCMDKSGSGVLGPIVKTKTDYYYDSNGNEKECTGTTKSTSQIFPKSAGLGGALQLAAPSEQQKGILTTLKQGFYINDSINEILKEFGYEFKGKEHTSNWISQSYRPDIRALSVAGYIDKSPYAQEEDKIGIRAIFDKFKSYGKCKIKFCTFACIRSPKKVLSDSIATLQFATAVNSCVNPVSVVSLPVKEERPAAGLTSEQLGRLTLTPSGLTPTPPKNKGGMSSRKNKRAIHNSTLKVHVNAKVKSSHVREKRKSTTRKHRKSIKNNKNNKRTIKNRV